MATKKEIKQAAKVLRDELGRKAANRVGAKAIDAAAVEVANNPDTLTSHVNRLKVAPAPGGVSLIKAVGIGLTALVVAVVLFGGKDKTPTEGGRQSVLHAAVNGNNARPATPAAAPAPVVKVTARQLAKECDDNEVAFVQRYKGKRVEVTGTVTSIDAGLLGGASVHLRGLNAFNTVLVDGLSKEFAATLSKGDKLRATCDRVDEVIGSPTLSGCK